MTEENESILFLLELNGQFTLMTRDLSTCLRDHADDIALMLEVMVRAEHPETELSVARAWTTYSRFWKSEWLPLLADEGQLVDVLLHQIALRQRAGTTFTTEILVDPEGGEDSYIILPPEIVDAFLIRDGDNVAWQIDGRTLVLQFQRANDDSKDAAHIGRSV